jgi:hypothetical protein
MLEASERILVIFSEFHHFSASAKNKSSLFIGRSRKRSVLEIKAGKKILHKPGKSSSSLSSFGVPCPHKWFR